MEGIIGGLILLLIWHTLRAAFSEIQTGPSLYQQAQDCAAAGEYAVAEQHLRRLVSAIENRDGYDAITVAICLRQLGWLKFNGGDKAAAQQIFQRVLAIQEKELGANSPDLVSTLELLIRLSREQGNHTLAVDLSRQLLSVRAAAFGPADPGASAAHNLLGLVLFEFADYAGAECAFRKARKPQHLQVLKNMSHASYGISRPHWLKWDAWKRQR